MTISEVDRVPVFDCDGHVTEPADLWRSRLPSRWGDRVPHTRVVPRTETSLTLIGEGPISDARLDHIEMWFTGDRMLSTAAGSARAGWEGAFPSFPPTLEHAIPATYDSTARLAWMDSCGIWAQVLYPNVGGFGSQTWRTMPDQELALACVRAYNDFLVEWISPAPERFVAMAAIPYWNITEAVSEIERVVDLGHSGIIFTGAPQDHDQPLLGDPHWDPLWSAAQANDLVVSFHLGSGNFGSRHNVKERTRREGPAQTFTRITAAGFLDSAQHMLDLLMCGVLERFPRLRFFAAESGIGWIPFLLESADYYFTRSGHRVSTDVMPSDHFRRQVYASFWFERTAPAKLVEEIGVDNIVFETDFPHPSCLHPPEEVDAAVSGALAGVTRDVRAKLLYENACRLFDRDPAAAALFAAASDGVTRGHGSEAR